MRDWAVFATLAHEGATPEQTAAATYQMPPARLPYLDELYSFNYGRGRRAYFGDRVLLFTDADDPDPTATAGRLADQVRMEIGEVPRSVEIYAVEDRRSEATLRVTRRARLAGPRLFSGEYGYVEAAVSDADQLAAWLTRVDDLSRVRIQAGKLLLGGRRFPHSRTEGVTIEDVAAIYQAPGRLHDRDAAAELDATAIMEQAGGPDDAGFSLDPRWLPAPDGRHPLMLGRLQQLANDPCAEISRIAGLAPKLLAAEPDKSRRSGEAWAAIRIASTTANVDPDTCRWLRSFIGPRIAPVITALEVASPQDWREGFAPFAGLEEDLQAALEGLMPSQGLALAAVLEALWFYHFDTGAQCARYDGIEGTEVGMTLFYTDLLAKLWGRIDYHHSAPLQSVPGFLTMPRVDVSPVFAEEMQRLPSTRIWFAPRADGWSRTVTTSASDMMFAARFSRVYAAGSNPADPDEETVPYESSRLMINWWDRHFDEIADLEQQYHRQNEIMKWSAAVAVMRETSRSPTFLSGVEVKRTAKFFTWLSAHRDQLRFKESLPEHRTPYSTECIALLQSYPFMAAGQLGNISGGVSLAGHDAVAAAPRLDPRLPRGQRMSPPTLATPRPRPVPAGRTVSIKDAADARTRSRRGPVSLGDVSARFEGHTGATTVSLDSKAGKLVEVGFAPSQRAVRMHVDADAIERARVLDGRRGTSISFEGRPERIVAYDRSLIEVTSSDGPRDAPVTPRANDTYPPGWHRAQAVDDDGVHRRMDGFAWQVVEPGRVDGELSSVRFSNEPPPGDARTVEVRGLEGIITARVTNDGEVFVARPEDQAARDEWHRLHAHAGAFHLWPGALLIDLKSRDEASELVRADRAAREGRLEDAAQVFERKLPKQPTTIDDKIRAAWRDIGYHRGSAARAELQALLDDRTELSPEESARLADSLSRHGERDIATAFEYKRQGKPVPAGLAIAESRGGLGLRYRARHIETAEVDAADATYDAAPAATYFTSTMINQAGFEPDFSGPIAHWLQEPRARVREWRARPGDLDSTAIIEFKPMVILDEETGREYTRAKTSYMAKNGHIYFIQSIGNSPCHRPSNGNGSAQPPGDARGSNDDCAN